MQKIAAYLLERRDGMEWPVARASQARLVKTEITSRLSSKGGTAIGP